MTSQARAAIWLDHHEARIFHVDLAGFDEKTLLAPQHHLHRHPKGVTEPHAHPDELSHFFAEIVKALASADEVLVLGPSTAKLQLLKYLHEHARSFVPKIIGIETADHPTDPQLIAHVKRYFHVGDARVR